MELRILGHVYMSVHGKPVAVGATKVRGLLGILSYKNEPVPAGYLVNALYDDDCPPDPVKTLMVYISRLRRVINESGFPGELVGRQGIYHLIVEPSIIDYHRFDDMVRTARRSAGLGNHGAAAELLTSALALWRGPPLADLRTSWARRLQEALTTRDLVSAQCDLLDAKLALGEHDTVLSMLATLLADHPYEDRFAGQWMRALAETDRSNEVTAFFKTYCQRLSTDLGIDPSDNLVEAHQNALGHRSSSQPTQPAIRAPSQPRQTPYFTGRDELLGQLDDLLTGSETAAVVALDGRPGVGKTTLVRHWARRHRDTFSDGMLHMDLAGYSTTTMVEPGTAMGMFLDELGVPATRIPHGTDDRAALLRHTLAGRRILVLLDNVRDSAHVRPLLLATEGCPVVITSRQRLTGLAVRDGARRITIPEFTGDEAATLLETLIGRRAVDEPAAVRELVTLCERLPLAVRLVGEHVATRQEMPLHDLVAELRQAHRLLDAGAHGDEDATLRTAFSWSYDALRSDHRRLFRLLGMFPTTRFSATAVAAAGGLGIPEVVESFGVLVGAHLVEQERVGRYRTHDLVHLYAAACARADEPDDGRELIMWRLLGWYVGSARNARRYLTADPHDVPGLPATESVEPLSFDAREAAKAWFDLERASLIALVRTAAELGQHDAAWRMAACLNVVYDHDLLELVKVQELGRASAALVGEHGAEAGHLSGMGVTYLRLKDNVRASYCFEQAYHLFHRVGDLHGEAVALHNTGAAHLRLGDPAKAIGYHRRALGAFSAVHNEWAVANVHRWLGDDHRALDQHDEANGHYLDSLYMSQKLGDDPGQGATLNRLALLNLEIGRPDQAVNTGLSALDIHDRTGDRGSAAEVLCTLAEARIELKDFQNAKANAIEAVRTQEQMNNTAGRAAASEILGHALAAAGDYDQAKEAWLNAAELLEAVDDARAPELRRLAERSTAQHVPEPRPVTPLASRQLSPSGTRRGPGSLVRSQRPEQHRQL